MRVRYLKKAASDHGACRTFPVYVRGVAQALSEKWPKARVTVSKLRGLKMYRIEVLNNFARPVRRQFEANALLADLVSYPRQLRIFIHVRGKR